MVPVFAADFVDLFQLIEQVAALCDIAEFLVDIIKKGQQVWRFNF